MRTGSAPEANAILVPKPAADRAMEAAACIGCGACVAACPNASAALFTGAKISHLGVLPQGQPERGARVLSMTAQARAEGFGHCTTIGECEAVCPAGIRLEVIARMNRDWLKTSLARRDDGRAARHRAAQLADEVLRGRAAEDPDLSHAGSDSKSTGCASRSSRENQCSHGKRPPSAQTAWSAGKRGPPWYQTA